MNKRAIIGLTTAGILLIATTVGSTHNPQSSNLNNVKNTSNDQPAATKSKTPPQVKPICDGTTITTDCTVDGVDYTTYIYHPAVPEKSHTETTTTYQRKITGYCTLCNDGTYSPSCATGRGACSWHGGVNEWNAPRYANVPVETTNIVIDAPAQASYYEKVSK